MKLSVGIAIITYKAKKHLPYCLPPLLSSPLNPKILVVNSSSNDGTVELAKEMGADILTVPRNTFNHGLTREKARKHLNTDIVVFVTPDAYCIDSCVLTKLIDPLIKKKASIAYARQLPHQGANFFESFSREFNYPENSHIRGIEDIHRFGVYTFFCSNSFAAYYNSALDEIGGFPNVLLGEDTFAVSKLLQKGHKIAYVAEACVYHSHRYTLWQEFQRHFDIGLAREIHKKQLANQSDHKRGIAYTKALFKKVLKEKPYLLPYAFIQTFFKYLGYRLGKISVKTPIWFKKFLSSQDFYWESSSIKHI